MCIACVRVIRTPCIERVKLIFSFRRDFDQREIRVSSRQKRINLTQFLSFQKFLIPVIAALCYVFSSLKKKKYFFSNLFGVLSSVGDLLPLSTRVYFKTSWSYTRLPGDRSLAYSCTGKLIYVQYMNIYSIGKCNIYAAFIQISSKSTSFKNLNLNYYYYFNSIFFFCLLFLKQWLQG